MEADEPKLKRRSNAPRRFQQSSAYHHETPEDLYRATYFEAMDSAIQCLTKRTESKSTLALSAIECMITNAWDGKSIAETDFQIILEQYGDDIDISRLRAQLFSLANFPKDGSAKSICDIIKYIGESQLNVMVPQVCRLIQLYLVNPATTASNERAFSRLRRLKSYLRQTMTQTRLNDLFLMNMYQEVVDSMSQTSLINDFILSGDEKRRNAFALL